MYQTYATGMSQRSNIVMGIFIGLEKAQMKFTRRTAEYNLLDREEMAVGYSIKIGSGEKRLAQYKQKCLNHVSMLLRSEVALLSIIFLIRNINLSSITYSS
jgi:hypothetical protein